jgi:hypothetical protein
MTTMYADPAPIASLELLRGEYPALTREYFDFLGRSNGAEGPLGIDPGWFVVWPAEEAIVASRDYQVPKYLPGYFAYGGNGGGELFVIPVQSLDGPCPVQMVPAIGMSPTELQGVADSFSDFVSAMGKEWR